MSRSFFPLYALALLLRAVFRALLDPRVPLRLKALVPLALLYVVLPLDLVPDFIPLAGWLDDLLLLLLALGLVAALGQAHRRARRSASPRPKVIEGCYRMVDEEAEE